MTAPPLRLPPLFRMAMLMASPTFDLLVSLVTVKNYLVILL
ncbi:hypothetical protein COLO4_36816 [Corchorus olitorius]|uniref:Uncharacterized protein n=1 Tax=Corchorus olitorius TaxID=93759 RepID=A0A1R3G567_9ROSI|nr:hypothetical protein COLO4_36816 [Corchorus olitorius]